MLKIPCAYGLLFVLGGRIASALHLHARDSTEHLVESVKPQKVLFTSESVEGWRDVDSPVIPMVSPFEAGKNVHSGEDIFYDPRRGYSFPCNGQNYKFNNIFYNTSVLSKVFNASQSHQIFSQEDAARCIAGKWIQIDGDSLARDNFYDLTELFGMTWNEKSKSHADMVQKYANRELFENTLGFDQEQKEGMEYTHAGGTKISFGWDPTSKSDGTPPSWYGENGKDCPDVWVYSTGLWDNTKNTTFAKYESRLKAVAQFDDSCVKTKVLRLTTPFAFGVAPQYNEYTIGYNRIAKLHLQPKGFKTLDTWPIVGSRPELSQDGVHYTGPGSKWITNELLNLIC